MNIEMIRQAAERASGRVRTTPLLNAPLLDARFGRRIFVKAECLQITGSFKFRGAWSAISGKRPRGGVFAYSSGNHAQGVAAAAAAHGIPATILMPSNAPQLKIENTKAYGAEVVTYDRATESREELGQALARQKNLTLIRPYDDEHVIAGQGTTGLEIATQCAEAGVETAEVIVPCGGGGLTAGIATTLAEDAPGMKVRPSEPEGFDDVARSLQAGTIQSNAAPEGSIADAILTESPGKRTFPILRDHCGPGLVVTDDECLKAMALAFQYLKIVVEPGGAVALAAALFHGDEIKSDDIVVVASGGNVDAPVFQQALDTLEM